MSGELGDLGLLQVVPCYRVRWSDGFFLIVGLDDLQAVIRSLIRSYPDRKITLEPEPEQTPLERPGKPGEWAWIAAGLDEYHAVNLREALKLVPDTGDWHGSLRAACDIALKDRPAAKPNQTAEQMLKTMDAARS